MKPDAPYRQLVHLLSARALNWVRHALDAEPAPAPGSTGMIPLAAAGRLVPVLAGWRGTPTPLEDFVRRHLSAETVNDSCGLVMAGADQATALAQTVLAGRDLALGDGDTVAAAAAELARNLSLPLHLRLALTGTSGPDLLAEAEDMLRQPVQPCWQSPEQAQAFAQTVLQLYRHGTHRPQFSSARAYGEIFANGLAIADHARSRGQVVPLAQMAVALRMIDADFDIHPTIADLIPFQRPDGSFPAVLKYGTTDQTLPLGADPTLSVIAILYVALYRRRQPPLQTVAA